MYVYYSINYNRGGKKSLRFEIDTETHIGQKTAVHYTCVCLFVLYCAGLYT